MADWLAKTEANHSTCHFPFLIWVCVLKCAWGLSFAAGENRNVFVSGKKEQRRGTWWSCSINSLPGLRIDFKLYLTTTIIDRTLINCLPWDLLRFWASGNGENPIEPFTPSYGHKQRWFRPKIFKRKKKKRSSWVCNNASLRFFYSDPNSWF